MEKLYFFGFDFGFVSIVFPPLGCIEALAMGVVRASLLSWEFESFKHTHTDNHTQIGIKRIKHERQKI